MGRLRSLVIMPFAPRFDPVFAVVREVATSALPGEEIDCYWLKDVRAAGRITDDIVEGIQHSAFCIADLTENNANVMWETGFAMALGKPTILIAQDVAALPFDLKVHRVLPYRPEGLEALAGPLGQAIRQTLARHDAAAPVSAAPPPGGPGMTIAVTGSSQAHQGKLHRRIDQVLRAYLALSPVWYTGSLGDTDDAVVSYLVEKKQSVVAVGFNRFDLSEKVRKLAQEGKVAFLDAQAEALPPGMKGPSERDVLFAAKADLVVLFWDRQSVGTQHLLRYFEEAARGLAVGFL